MRLPIKECLRILSNHEQKAFGILFIIELLTDVET